MEPRCRRATPGLHILQGLRFRLPHAPHHTSLLLHILPRPQHASLLNMLQKKNGAAHVVNAWTSTHVLWISLLSLRKNVYGLQDQRDTAKRVHREHRASLPQGQRTTSSQASLNWVRFGRSLLYRCTMPGRLQLLQGPAWAHVQIWRLARTPVAHRVHFFSNPLPSFAAGTTDQRSWAGIE